MNEKKCCQRHYARFLIIFVFKQVLPVTTPVKMDVGVKDPTTARSSPRPTVHPSVIRAGASDPTQGNAVTCSVQVDVQVPSKVTALPAGTSMMTGSANKNVLR